MECSGVLPKPMPGSTIRCSRGTPQPRASLMASVSQATTSSKTPSGYSATSLLCISTRCAPASAAAVMVVGSFRPAHTSLTMVAPAASAWRATSPLMVSMLTSARSPNSRASAATVGTAMAASCCADTGGWSP